MTIVKKMGWLLSMLGMVFLALSPVQAAMVSTDDAMAGPQRQQLVEMLERQDVQQQLVAMGVDPANALARVDQMTVEELVQLNGQIEQLPAGAGVGTLELLLIIIILILIL
ncbi:MAG: PA2779 family protein [Chromatiales bacterium]|nr:PA2779 family protein [Chromatiales bacterium]